MYMLRSFADVVVAGDAAALLTVVDKADLLAVLADYGADQAGITASLILERVFEREALGSTGFGGGAAIPHARIPGLARITIVIAHLAKPVDYGALDGEPVDIAVLLLSPADAGADHLKALARISRALRDPAVLAAVRVASDATAVLRAVGWEATVADAN